jgi:hypothetical protein
MTAAFAQELGLNVRFQEVLGLPAVERNGELTFVVGHVNLALGSGLLQRVPAWPSRAGWWSTSCPGRTCSASARGGRRAAHPRHVHEQPRRRGTGPGRVQRGLLVAARRAGRRTRSFANLYNTLGVVYRHRGALAEAERRCGRAGAGPRQQPRAGNLAGVLLRCRAGRPTARCWRLAASGARCRAAAWCRRARRWTRARSSRPC